MTESGRKTCRKIQATKHWLTSAEQHFDQNSSARGEMDLLLAEAELRSTRENLKNSSSGVRSFWVQHGLAFGVAFAVVAFGLSGAWLWSREGRESVSAPVPAIPAPAVVSAPLAVQPEQPKISTVPVQKTEETPSATVVPTNPRQEVNNNNMPATREAPVSQDEMKRLVRTAGQSLRGQPKQ